MVNKVILIGHVGNDPEIHTFDSGNSKASFSLATNEVYKPKDGEKKEITQWHNVVAYGKVVDVIVAYVKKGSLIYVDGKVTYRSWETTEGVKKYITEIVMDNLKLLGGKPAVTDQQPIPKNEDEPPKSNTPAQIPDDDLPF